MASSPLGPEKLSPGHRHHRTKDRATVVHDIFAAFVAFEGHHSIARLWTPVAEGLGAPAADGPLIRSEDTARGTGNDRKHERALILVRTMEETVLVPRATIGHSRDLIALFDALMKQLGAVRKELPICPTDPDGYRGVRLDGQPLNRPIGQPAPH